MTSPLDGYKPRDWSVYVISIAEGQDLPTEGTFNEFLVLLSDSPQAIGMASFPEYDPDRFFFPDVEQLNAGHNNFGYATPVRLTAWWRDHAPGKLAFVTYENMGDDPPMFTFYVEK